QKQFDRAAAALFRPEPHRQGRDQHEVEPGVKGEEGLQIGLAAVEEIADKEGQDAREHKKDNDEQIGERGRKIAPELAAEDGEGAGHNSGSVRERVLGKWGGDRAKHVVETAALDIEAGNGPAAFAGKPDD